MNVELINFVRKISALETIEQINIACINTLLAQIDNDPAINTVTIYDDFGGKMFNVLSAVKQDLQNLWIRGEKIHAIKDLRNLTGWGLLETKRAMENPRNFKQPGGNW